MVTFVRYQKHCSSFATNSRNCKDAISKTQQDNITLSQTQQQKSLLHPPPLLAKVCSQYYFYILADCTGARLAVSSNQTLSVF
jgi:hypothetical protein